MCHAREGGLNCSVADRSCVAFELDGDPFALEVGKEEIHALVPRGLRLLDAVALLTEEISHELLELHAAHSGRL